MLDAIARGQHNPNIKQTLEYANQTKQIHRLSTNRGYTPKRDYRYVAEIPKGIFFHPEFQKYWDPRMDSHTLRKSFLEFINKYPQYAVVDKV